MVHEHFPDARKHLAPTTLPVANIAFVVNVVGTAVRHQMVVSTVKEVLLAACENVAQTVVCAVLFVTANGRAPFCNHLSVRKTVVALEELVKSVDPTLGGSGAVSLLVPVSEEKFVKPVPDTPLAAAALSGPHPATVVDEVAMTGLGGNGIKVKGVQITGRDVRSWKTERGMMMQELFKTVHLVGSRDVVHHGKQHAAHGVSERDGFGELAAVDAD